MKFSRRDFLKLSTVACAWFLTACTTNEREIPISQGTASGEAGASSAAGTVKIPTMQTQGSSGILKEGIQIPAEFELPLEGSTGFVGSATLPLRASASESSTVLRTLSVGDMFYIKEESGSYWKVCVVDGTEGWVRSDYCMINLPDVVPSILYDDPNAAGTNIINPTTNAMGTGAVFVSCGKALSGITAAQLYDGVFFNPRLDRREFVMPINYNMAKKVGNVQKAALQNGDSLRIIETFRPYEVQMRVKEALYALSNSDSEVRKKLNEGSWNIGWFISTTLSNHQRGVAMDTSLVHIAESEAQSIAGCEFSRPTLWDEYEMPSVMHELSDAAACFTTPVTSSSKTAWKSATVAPTMTDGALLLQKYCTDADLTPLASEWWHFNDLDAESVVKGSSGRGEFYMEGCLSWRMFEQ